MDFITVDFDKSVNRRTFDCVSPDLNDYIVKYASQDQKRHLSRTFLALGKERTRWRVRRFALRTWPSRSGNGSRAIRFRQCY